MVIETTGTAQVDVGVDIPQFVLADTGPLVARYAARAEELGFAGLWTMDDVLSLLLAEALEANGRDRDRFPIAKRVYISVDEDSGRARRRLGEYVDSAYGREDLGELVGVYGPSRALRGTAA